MLGYCETTTCRREVLLTYFSDKFKGPCGNCDICLNEIKPQVDVTKFSLEMLRQLHSGAGKTDMEGLLTQTLEEMSDNNISFSQIEMIYRELVAIGAINESMDGSKKLSIGAIALEILDGSRNIFINSENFKKAIAVKVKVKVSRAKKVKKTKVKKECYGDEEAFNYLKKVRRALAKKKRTKAFKVFPDQTLYEMVQVKPTSLSQLELIYGVGPKKLKKFGQEFIEAIKEIS